VCRALLPLLLLLLLLPLLLLLLLLLPPSNCMCANMTCRRTGD
jgi:hypothetical protein